MNKYIVTLAVSVPAYAEIEIEAESQAAAEQAVAKAPDLLFAAKCALADLEGIMPEFEPSGDREHPAWETIKLLKKAIQ
jgi:nicotinate-nucleotide pyrophosphorylase